MNTIGHVNNIENDLFRKYRTLTPFVWKEKTQMIYNFGSVVQI